MVRKRRTDAPSEVGEGSGSGEGGQVSGSVPQVVDVVISNPMQMSEPPVLAQQFEQLSIKQGAPSQPLPSSSNAYKFPMRPGKGNTGKSCIVKAIHFFAALPDKDLHQYDVTITPSSKIVEGQQYSKRLSERQITALLKVTYQRPLEREKDILRTVALNNYKDYPYAKEFGIKISTSLASVEARILPPPWLKYHDSGREGTCFPQVGQWNMMNKKMINGGTVNNWFCIIFSRQVQDNLARTFCQELAQMCYVSGIVSLPKHNLINILGL